MLILPILKSWFFLQNFSLIFQWKNPIARLLFSCWPQFDIKIFQRRPVQVLLSSKLVFDDDNCKCQFCIIPSNFFLFQDTLRTRICARNEISNARLNLFESLNYTYRHSLFSNRTVFYTVVWIIALSVSLKELLFQFSCVYKPVRIHLSQLH